MTAFENLKSLAQRVVDGSLVAIAPDYSWVPMALVRELIRRKAKGLSLLTVPISGMAADILIGAGVVVRIETAAVTLGEIGLAPRFTDAVESGSLSVLDSTCPAIHTALQASEKGVPFMPLGGLIGSDLVHNRDDWKVIDDPLGLGGGPVLLLPAIKPDVALFHSSRADKNGNVWIGRRRELMTMAHASKEALVTVEEIENRDFLEDENMAAGTLPAMYVKAIAKVKKGAWPQALSGYYERDLAHIRAYAKQAKTREGFQAYLASQVLAEDLHE
jgi:glutaconate CoA-transferase subunit A